MQIDYEPRLVEEAVLRALRGRPEERLFHREREHAYRIPDPDARGAAFDALNFAWYERLGFARPLAQALDEQPLLRTAVARCAIGRSLRRTDAGSELLVRAPRPEETAAECRLLRILVSPDAVVDGDAFSTFLRRELQHAADMLDPRFGYEPTLPPSGGPAHDRLLRDRYRVIWDTTVDGRLVRTGRLTAVARTLRRDEFLHAFVALGADAPAAFARFFDDPAPTHAAIVNFVRTLPSAAAGTCALCGFPTMDLEPDVAALPKDMLLEIADEFPGWAPETGCCRQCAEIYRTRQLSAAAAAALPGIR